MASRLEPPSEYSRSQFKRSSTGLERSSASNRNPKRLQGFGAPFFGAFAEKIGDRKAIILGAVLYAIGLVLTTGATSPLAIQFYEILVGFGIAGTGFGVILAVVGRASAPEHRSMSLAIATAAGSAGQIVRPMVAVILLESMAWQSVFMIFAASILAVLLLLPFMRAPERAAKEEIEETLGEILESPSRIHLT